jgi:hypothetical protein
MIDGANPRHPVIIVDDTLCLENDSLWNLSSLLMNIATMALEEAYYHEQKTITAEILYNFERFNKSE